MKEFELIVEDCRLNYIFRSVEPVPESVLLSWLTAAKFEAITDVPRKIGTPTFGIERMNIARKGTSEVLYDNIGGTLGIAGRNIKEIIEIFDIIGSILMDNGLNLPSNVKSFELVLVLRAFFKGMKKPLEEIGEFSGMDRFSEFSKIMGEEVMPFNIRFCPRREAQSSESFRTISDWFDIQIHPYVPNPNYFEVRAVFRNSDSTKIIEFAKTAMDKIADMISVILRGK